MADPIEYTMKEANSDTSQHDLELSNVTSNDPAEKALTWKLDLHIMPFLFGLSFFSFLDRANIGNAAIEGIEKDLKLTGDKFNIVLTILYIPYLLMALPSNLILKRIGAGRYLPSLIIAWGIVDTCMGSVKSYSGLLVCRFFLGLCEGGLIGGMVIYLAMFYRKNQLALRIALFFCASPFSGAVGGLLATGLSEIKYNGYNRWPWIFFIEGILTVLFGCIALIFLPSTPSQARFLTEVEKGLAVSRMSLDAHHAAAPQTDVRDEIFSWHWVRIAVLNPNTILCGISNFLILVPTYSFALFLPTLIKALGYQRVTAQLFTVPPNALGFVTTLLVSYFSDRLQLRFPFILAGLLTTIVGYAMLIAAPLSKPGISYAGTFFVAAGIFPLTPVLMAWLANNLSPHYVRATGNGVQITMANFSAFVGTFAYLKSDAPRYTTGHSINLAFLCLACLLMGVEAGYVRWENGMRERGERDGRLEGGDEGELGCMHPGFRYTL